MSYRHKHIKPKIKSFKKKKPFFKKPVFWIAAVAAFAGTAGLLIVFLPQVQIKSISISGNEEIKTQDLEVTAWQNINKTFIGIQSKSIFMASASNIKKEILRAFPAIEDVNVKKRFLGSIAVSVTERTPFAVFCNEYQEKTCFVMDENGIIFKEAGAGHNLLVIYAKNPSQIAPGQSPIDQKMVEGIKTVQRNLQNNFQLGVTSVLASNPLVFTTQEDWEIYLNPSQDISSQITKLNLLLQEGILPSARKNLQYIYLQYEDRAYYK